MHICTNTFAHLSLPRWMLQIVQVKGGPESRGAHEYPVPLVGSGGPDRQKPGLGVIIAEDIKGQRVAVGPADVPRGETL